MQTTLDEVEEYEEDPDYLGYLSNVRNFAEKLVKELNFYRGLIMTENEKKKAIQINKLFDECITNIEDVIIKEYEQLVEKNPYAKKYIYEFSAGMWQDISDRYQKFLKKINAIIEWTPHNIGEKTYE